MKISLYMITFFAFVPAISLASTICGRIEGFPMYTISNKQISLHLITEDQEILEKIEALVDDYVCVVGELSELVYKGFDVLSIISNSD